MTNILYWNIRQFSIDLINIPGAAGAIAVPGIAGLTNAVAAQQRLGVITDVIAWAQADIISIVEMQSGANAQGDLATNGGGLRAASFLLDQLRGADHAAEWRMVPPLWLGLRQNNAQVANAPRAESVAVLYRGVTGNVERYFTGPNVWTIGAGGVAAIPGAGAPQNYPPPFDTYIDDAAAVPPNPPVPARNIPVAPGPVYRAGQPENQSAARIAYTRASTKRPRGGVPYNPQLYGGFRPPYMTSFYEVDNTVAPVMQRNLTLFSMHSPPNTSGAKSLMTLYSQTPEIYNAPAATETKIICGDFNINFLNAQGAYSGAYAPVTGVGYQSLLPNNLLPPGDPEQLRAYVGYFATHIRDQPPAANAPQSKFLWSNPPANSYYPGYGYVSTGSTGSIDNILVNPAAALPLTIINLVAGAPYAATTVGVPPNAPIAPPLGVAVPGGGAFATRFTAPPAAWPLNPTAANYIPGDAVSLCEWDNYGRVYSTSDHFALVTTL